MRAFLAVFFACVCVGAASQDGRRDTRLPYSKADGDRFATKYAAIMARNPAASAASRKAIQTVVTEPEVNAYLRYRAKDIPVGVVDPYVFALGDGRLAGVATVDLDAVRLSRPRGMFDLAQLMRGQVVVTAAGVLRSTDGVFRFELESATVGGLEVPKTLLQELVGYYSRTPSNPAGFSLDAPFQLPAGIRDLIVQAKKAIIVQ